MGARAKTNVVDSAASLIGRVAEREAIAAWFAAGVRLVTICGPGGLGKTRLATRFAAERATELSSHGAGGAWFCDLTEVRSGAAIEAALAAAARVTNRDLGAALARKKRTLVVLDNFEHLVAEAPSTLGAWMRAAPHAMFLVTSRVPLGLPGEQVLPLEPLDEGCAIELFVARAQQQRPDLTASDAAVPALVKKLDGIPLAIELAAARTRALSPEHLLARLDRPLAILVRPGDAGRHGSMRRTVLDSVEALAPALRDAFARCACFRGGFTLAAAEQILGGDAVDVLDGLCKQSLLRLDRDGRYQLYEPIREVAAELLQTLAAREQVALDHARYFAALGRELAAASEPLALARLASEHDNLLLAYRNVCTTDGALATALALGIDPLLATRGQHRLRIAMLDDERASDDDRAATLIARAHAYRELGELERARADLDRARAAANDPARAALALARIGELVEITGDTEAARRDFEAAIALLGGASAVVEAELQARLAHALRRENKLRAADVAIERATARYRETGHVEGVAAMAYEAAVVALFENRHAAARGLLDGALATARELGNRQLEAAIVSAMGIVAQELGDSDEAIRHHASAVQVFRDLGNRHREGSALYYLGAAYLERGEAAQSIAIFDRAAECARAVGAARYEALIAGARGAAAAALGDASAAASALADAERAARACKSEPGVLAALAIHRLAADDRALATARSIVDATPGDDPRQALRILRARLATSTPPETATLVIRDGGFRAPHATDDVDLSSRHPLRRIVDALVRHRLGSPGDALDIDELVAAGWPGERMHHDAATNRLHVALTTLRKLGLRELLVTSDRGYLLDPSVPVRTE